MNSLTRMTMAIGYFFAGAIASTSGFTVGFFLAIGVATAAYIHIAFAMED